MLAGRKSFDRDADRLEAGWDPASKGYPPFWSHLLFSCYAADTVESEDRDFRRRLAELLKLERSPQLSRLLPQLWEKVAKWTEVKRGSGADCRVLVLPDPGSFTIIGYSLGLSFPRLRDNHLLASVLGRTSFLGKEPPVWPVVRAIEDELRNFTPPFISAFEECRDGFAETGNVNWFWSCIREAALYARWSAPNEARWTVLLSIGRQSVALSLASSEPYADNKWGTFEGRFTSLGWLSVCHGSLDGVGIEQAVLNLFGSSIQTPRPMKDLRGLITTEVLLFSLETPGVYRSSLEWPEFGPIAIACTESIGRRVARKISRDCEALNISGWCVFASITPEELTTIRGILPKIYQDGLLSKTAPPPRLVRRGGFVANFSKASYLGLADLTPTFHVSSADAVTAVLEDGTSQQLVFDEDADGWRLPTVSINGVARLTAIRAEMPIAALAIDFRSRFESQPDIKVPRAPSEWWTESIYGASVSSADLFKEPEFDFDDLPNYAGLADRLFEDGGSPISSVGAENGAPDNLREAMASCFSQRRSISLDEWFEWSSQCMRLSDTKRWECLRLWQYAGLLYRLRPKSWAGSQLFGVAPHLLVFRSGANFFARTTGCFTKVMLGRLRIECAKLGLSARSINTDDPMLPTSFLIGGASSGELIKCAAQLGIHIKPVKPLGGDLASRLDLCEGEVLSFPPLTAKPDKVIFVNTDLGRFQIERFSTKGLSDRYVVTTHDGKRICFLTSFAAFSAVYQISQDTFFERVSPAMVAASQRRANLPAAIGTYLICYSGMGNRPVYTFISDDAVDYVLAGLTPPVREEPQKEYSHPLNSRAWQVAYASKNNKRIILPPSLGQGVARVAPTFAIPWFAQGAQTRSGCTKKAQG